MRSCGDKPELVAIGVAPLGIISIGVVPMGVVSIGAVHRGAVQALAYRDPEQARARALALGCTGVHRMGSRWMPCATHP